MSRTAYRISITLHVVCFAILTAVVGSAPVAGAANDAGSGSYDDRWLPSLAMTMGFTSHRIEGSVESIRFVSLFGGVTSTLRPSDFNAAYVTALNAGGIFELSTPALPIKNVRPRIFFGGEVEHVSSQRRSIARDGDPRADLVEPVGNNPFSELEILGRGSATTADLDTLQFGAHVGLSFPVQIGDWLVSIKPSARYINQKLLLTGIVSEGKRGNDPTVRFPRSVQTNLILLQASESSDIHAVGPGLEIEIAAGGVRSLSASIFVSGGAYRVLTDTNITLSTTGRDSFNTGFTTYTGTWNVDLDPWIYRANVGFRVRWTGARGGWLFTQ